MKNVFNKIKVIVLVSFLLIANGYAQDTEIIVGTIGNEKMGNDKTVICVFGTAACMPVNIDTAMTVKYQNKETKLTELPFGLYLEAEVGKDAQGRNVVKNILIDENKTVLCFKELGENKENKLSNLLGRITGVKSFNINPESNQAYIEFDSKTIAYKDLEKRVSKEGFQLE